MFFLKNRSLIYGSCIGQLFRNSCHFAKIFCKLYWPSLSIQYYPISKSTGVSPKARWQCKAGFGRVMENTPLKHPHPENITAATASCPSCAGGTLLGIQISDQAGEVSLKHSLKVQGSEIRVHCPAILRMLSVQSQVTSSRNMPFMGCLTGSDQKQLVFFSSFAKKNQRSCLKRLPFYNRRKIFGPLGRTVQTLPPCLA